MAFNIAQLNNPDNLVESYDTTYYPTFTTVADDALEIETETEAETLANNINSNPIIAQNENLVGTTPIRK